jgi:CRP-like cAMP-binding protein
MNQNILDKITDFFADAPIKNYKKGDTITMAGEDPDGVSLLVEGVVEQYDITPAGNKVVVNMFKPPAFFPMSWAMNKTPNTYFFAALSDATLKRADADATVQFLQDNPDVTFNLLSRVYKGTDALLRRLMLAASGIATNRLIYELLLEAYRFGTENNDNTATITAKQASLAARSGLARETVNRELHKLEEEGALTLQDGVIIVQIKTLEQKLDFTP